MVPMPAPKNKRSRGQHKDGFPAVPRAGRAKEIGKRTQKTAGKIPSPRQNRTSDPNVQLVEKDRQLVKTIQWYPGHMAKAKREMVASIRMVDIVLELIDARIPKASRNPDLAALRAGKPSLLLLNKSGLADPQATALWKQYYEDQGECCLVVDCHTGMGVDKIVPEVRRLLSDRLAHYESRGMTGRLPRAMIAGITNCGKSTLANRLFGAKKAKAEDRPGVTRSQMWLTVRGEMELLDTPGLLWPKFKDEQTGLALAFTGAVRDEILDTEEVAGYLCQNLAERYPALFAERYGLDPQELAGQNGYHILEQIAAKRGFLMAGGAPDLLRCAGMLLDEFRAGKIGRITLEWPQKQ